MNKTHRSLEEAELLGAALRYCAVASGPEDRSVVLLFSHLVRNLGTTEMARHDRYARTQRALAAYPRGEDLGGLAPVTSELFPLPEKK